jgi:alpha-galactosidase
MKHTASGKHGVSRMAGAVLAGLMLVTAHGATGAEKTAPAESPKNEEMKMKNQWVQEHLTEAKAKLPFSFVYDGKASDGLLAGWTKKVEEKKLDANRTEHTLRWTDPKSGLEVRCVAVDYADYPAAEWTVYFKNTGTTHTPILENIQGLDAQFDAGAKGEFVLHGIKGDFMGAESYEPYRLALTSGSVTTFSPRGPIWAGDGTGYGLGKSLSMPGTGKSCDGPDGWPYFNLQTPGGGVILAVGWPGQWAASFTRDAGTGLTVRAGQELTHFCLKPGEEARTPLMAMLFWEGVDMVPAQNLWRRWYRAHTLPRIQGKPQPAVASYCGSGNEQEMPIIQAWLDAGIHLDVLWRDAGGSRDDVWFTLNPDPLPYPWPGMYWMNSGTWTPDPKKYPKGFKPYSDWIRTRGMQFMLWFEPERVGDPNSWLGKNHPEWLLPNDNMGAILDEGNPAARQWLTDHISGMIESQGLDWYREDMNGGGPCPAWRKNDAPDRQGMTENLYVQGHLAFWDELRRRHPHLRIDSCASGGRRNDLETMRRAVPLLRSDFQLPSMAGVVEGNQGHTYGLSFWLPFQGSGFSASDPYMCRSFYLPACVFNDSNREPTAAKIKVYRECRQIAPMMLEGDYYPLTAYSLAPENWIAWQFHRPEKGDGVVQVFRRGASSFVRAEFRLRGLDPAAIYEVRNFDAAGSTKVSGKDLMEKGLPVELKERPGSAVIVYTCGVTAAITPDHAVGEQPLPVRFDGSGSSCSSGKLVSYEWEFGDGAISRDVAPAHTYEQTGRHTAKLTVGDDQGRRDTAFITVSVTPADTVAPTITTVDVRIYRMALTAAEVQKVMKE